MKVEDITIGNIKSFIQGHSRFYLDKISLLPTFKKEQVFYRIYICRDTCIPFKKCEVCKCPAIKKSYADASCNLEKFPNLMGQVEWEKYKVEHNLSQENISNILQEVESLFNR